MFGKEAKRHKGRDAVYHSKRQMGWGKKRQGTIAGARAQRVREGHHHVLAELRLALAFCFRGASSQGRSPKERANTDSKAGVANPKQGVLRKW